MPPATEMVSGMLTAAATFTSLPDWVVVFAFEGASAGGVAGTLEEAMSVAGGTGELTAVADAMESVPGAGEKGDSGATPAALTAVVALVVFAVTDCVPAGSLGAGAAVAVGEGFVLVVAAAASAPPPPPPHPVSAIKAAPQKSPAIPFRFWSAIIKKHLRFNRRPGLCAR
jgi:hypothetical protein